MDPIGAGDAVVGPPGCSLGWRRLTRTTTCVLEDNVAHHLVVVRSGELALRPRGHEPVVLLPRDAYLLPPATACHVHALGEEVDVLCLTYQERAPGGAWAYGGRERGGLVRSSGVRPLRERIPIRWAPAIHDVLSPRTLLPLVGPVAWGPGRFALRGPQGLVVALVTTPTGTGPALHVHTQSTEIFVVLEGTFRIVWGEEGEHEVLLHAGDVVVIPPGYNRAFEAVGEGPHWLLPIVVGADDETEDIAWLPAVERRLRAVAHPVQVAIARRARLRIAARRPTS